MRNKLLVFLLLGIFLISLVTSVSGDDLGNFKQDTCINLNNHCPTCSYIDLTAIKYGGGLIDTTLDIEMTKQGDNYHYEFCNTTELGDYYYTTCGDKAGQRTCENIEFHVTTSGRGGSSNIAFTIILIIIIYAITIFSFYIRNIPLTVLTGMFMAFFGVWIVRNGIIIYRDNLTNYFGYVTGTIGAIVALWALVEYIREEFY